MYSDKITQLAIEKIERAISLKLKRYPINEVVGLQEHFSDLVKETDTYGNVTALARPLTPSEKQFIVNETWMCALDFHYWVSRYCFLVRDGSMGGGIGRMNLWEAQRIVMDVIAKAEEECYESSLRGEPVDGIRIVDHKSRQLGGTQLKRSLDIHRVTTGQYQRGIVASVDEEKIHKIYERDSLIISKLPFYLRPRLESDVKDQHIKFATGSTIQYSQSNQKGGLGQGEQFDLAHLTECSSWGEPLIIELFLFPALPQGPNTLAVLESTANGIGDWWNDFTERVRRGKERGWRYVFVPWYAEPTKYRATPPVNWVPNSHTLMHAAKVIETSSEFCGKRVELSKEQLYWYECEFNSAREKGRLNVFLTNYAATPEESFQHSGQSAFPTELIDELNLSARWGVPYEIQVGVV